MIGKRTGEAWVRPSPRGLCSGRACAACMDAAKGAAKTGARIVGRGMLLGLKAARAGLDASIRVLEENIPGHRGGAERAAP